VMFPIEDPRLKARIVGEILPAVLADNVKARLQKPDGTYTRLTPPDGEPGVRSQVVLQGVARESARTAGQSRRRPFQRIPRRTNDGKNGDGGAARAPRRSGTEAARGGGGRERSPHVEADRSEERP